MNIHKMIADLQAEKARLDEAILALERLSAGKVKRRSKREPLPEPESHAESPAAKAHGTHT